MDNKLENILKQVEKPGRYVGGEYGQVIKNKENVKVRMAFCFPDVYEIGMSNLGMKILYGALNTDHGIWCERVFAPWTDMEGKLRENSIPLYALESGDPLTAFDIVGFTLQYELCYSNVLNMLELAGITLLSDERGESEPIIIGGGPCAYNAEPTADFFDVFSIGEGEEALLEFMRLYISMKEYGTYTRRGFLRAAAELDGFYVPSLYEVEYNADGTLKSMEPKYENVPKKVKKRIADDIDSAYFPDRLVMPYIETVHDRIMLEVFRGCVGGCRFCQAGMTFRPVREKTPETLNRQAKTLYENCGYDEISLVALSISDYSKLNELTDALLEWTDNAKVNLSLPSLRADSFNKELMEKITSVRTGGLTFAPEAGTQRLRDAINKNITEEDLLRACRVAYEVGKNQIKLYFMQGLPTEELADLAGIAALAGDIIDVYYKIPKTERPPNFNSRPPVLTVSISCFIPKPFTPFQWEAQDDIDTLRMKQKYIRERFKAENNKIKYNWHDEETSRLEAVFARGNRKLGKVILNAFKKGAKFDSWSEYFNYGIWMKAFEEEGIDPSFYANRRMGFDELLPWEIIDCGIDKEFLLSEREKAYNSETTPNCSECCSACGAGKNNAEGKYRWCPKN